MSAAVATVFVVDDDPVVRKSVARLARAAGYSVKTFARPTEFICHDLPAEPCCVLLDVCMDDMTGFDVQDALRQNGRRPPVVFLSAHGTVATAALGFKNGAEDFIEKPFRAKELMDAINRAIAHDRSNAEDREELDSLRTRYAELTPREQDVLKLVVGGRLNKQAAAELQISEKTIKVHRARVMEKMRVESFAALVLVAQRIGVTPAPASLVAAEAAPSWVF